MSTHLAHLADDYLHDLLDAVQKNSFEAHIGKCTECRLELEAAQRRFDALKAAQPATPDANLITSRLMTKVCGSIASSETRARRWKKTKRVVGGFIAASVLFLASMHLYYDQLHASPLNLEVYGQDNLISGSDASLRIRLHENDKPMVGVPIEIDLVDHAKNRTVEIARFSTDANGTASPQFILPEWDEGNYKLRVIARGGQNESEREQVERPVKLRRTANVMLSTDKPVYQPGQIIHIRSLALLGHNLKPLAQKSATLSVTDPKGNVVFKRTGVSSRFGLFSADCELATEINEGLYRITAQVGDTSSELSVDVKPYVLPKFKITVELAKPFFKAGEPIRGRVKAHYFYGKPVQGTARLQFADGTASDLPLANGEAGFLLAPPQITEKLDWSLTCNVTDTAGQEHGRTVPVTISEQDLLITAVAEEGQLMSGVPARIRFSVRTPDDQPVEATLTSISFPKPLVTNLQGDAEITFTPMYDDYQATITARAPDGRTVTQVVQLKTLSSTSGIILRPDRREYIGGETMNLTVHAPSGPLYLDFVRDGQTIRTETLAIKNGKGELAFDFPPDWFGAVDIHAYLPRDLSSASLNSRLPSPAERSNIQRTRIFLKPAQQLRIRGALQSPGPVGLPALIGGMGVASLDHRPGASTKLSLSLRDTDEKPVVGAISLAAIDEAVLSVYGSRKPNFGQNVPGLDPLSLPIEKVRRTPPEKFRSDENDEVTSSANPFSLVTSSLREKVERIEQQRDAGHLRGVFGWLGLFFLGVGYCVYRVWELAPRVEVLLENPTFPVIVIGWMLGACVVVGGCSNDKKPAFLPHASMESKSAERVEQASRSGVMQSPSIRVRDYFPETLLWKPELITDEQGRVELDFAWADSITSWRFSASAVSGDGRLGSWIKDVRVAQPFFVDVNLPVSLTRNDSITVPVVVSNYLPGRQTVRVELPNADWYTREGDAIREIELNEGEVKAVPFRVQVTKAGRRSLKVIARTATFNDAIARDILVNADGRAIENVVNSTLSLETSIPIDIPAEAIEGGTRATLKFYPTGFSQLVEGLEGIFQMPHGCFEQASSTTYPNVLALDYLKRTNKSNPQVEAKAKRFVHLGYQKLLTYEITGGGFDWYGRGPANRGLSAYGLMEFQDMASVYEVDPDLIARTRRWLLSERNGDGSWEPDWSPTLDRSRDALARFKATAYIAWAVFSKQQGEASSTLNYLVKHADQFANDPYAMALAANAVQSMHGDATGYLNTLKTLMKQSPDGKEAWWEMHKGQRSNFHATDSGADVESTALAVLALIESRANQPLVRQGLAWLVRQRSSSGTWGSTQATVLALKALVAGTTVVPDTERVFEVRLGNQYSQRFSIPADQGDVLKQIDLTHFLKPGNAKLEIRELSATSTNFQFTLKYHVPQTEKPKASNAFGLFLSVDHDTVKADESIVVTASVWNRREETAPMVMLELPIPAGFGLESDFKKLLADGKVDKIENKSESVVLYLRALEPGKILEIPYKLRAHAAAKVSLPPAQVYEYYAPERRASSERKVIEVK